MCKDRIEIALGAGMTTLPRFAPRGPKSCSPSGTRSVYTARPVRLRPQLSHRHQACGDCRCRATPGRSSRSNHRAESVRSRSSADWRLMICDRNRAPRSRCGSTHFQRADLFGDSTCRAKRARLPAKLRHPVRPLAPDHGSAGDRVRRPHQCRSGQPGPEHGSGGSD